MTSKIEKTTPVFQTIVGTDGWDAVLSAVDYPVMIRPLFYKHPAEEGYSPASGTTNTGRGTTFFAIVADRNKGGNYQAIATVTDTYGLLPTKTVYEDLKRDFEESAIVAFPKSLYVAANGGRQVLNVAIDGMTATLGNTDVSMVITLDTSVDGSKKHNIRISVMDDKGVELVGVTDTRFSFGTKHTKTVGERHVAFKTILMTLIAEWNSTIIPTMVLLNDHTFDKDIAHRFLTELLKNSDIPERHMEKALLAYTTTQRAEHSVLTVLHGASTYMAEELAHRPERLEEFRERLNKNGRKMVDKLLAKAN